MQIIYHETQAISGFLLKYKLPPFFPSTTFHTYHLPVILNKLKSDLNGISYASMTGGSRINFINVAFRRVAVLSDRIQDCVLPELELRWRRYSSQLPETLTAWSYQHKLQSANGWLLVGEQSLIRRL